jgi:hypothetical protein
MYLVGLLPVAARLLDPKLCAHGTGDHRFFFVSECVGASLISTLDSPNIHDSYEWDCQVSEGWRYSGKPGNYVSDASKSAMMPCLQPIDHLVMVQFENEFVHDAVYTDRPTDEIQACPFRICEHEMISIEICQSLTTNSSSEL